MTEKETRMFDLITQTWNPVYGCKHYCTYCWAKKLAEGRLSKTQEKYKDGFKPNIWEPDFKRKFKPNEFVFVSDMGDLFGNWVPKEWIQRVLCHIIKFPETTFLLLTKNPARYKEFAIPFNCICGATIESDKDYTSLSNAPRQQQRFWEIFGLKQVRKMVSIEPILDFDLDMFVSGIKTVKPEFVYVGFDNYNNNLPEPPIDKVATLIDELKKFTEVRLKKSAKDRLIEYLEE